ncbi:MAG: DNA topoisomerase IV subunit A [Bacilli bacterium]|nr:DNA topoisomerase IV subunit A [Bacilli bacterium]
MSKKKTDIIDEIVDENISIEPLEDVMGDRYATYAKYVIQDRAIPDVRDGLKPVQRRIIFSMYENGNTFNKPTKKCAHTVGAVMGTYHPHGDTSIYEALARMSQDWKVRYPLIDFQGNNGSIDGDSPAAYRYTESRLSELSNELVSDLEKKTVDMQLNFDDTKFEPIVLPSKFPNLLVNGTEGIAVAIATEIPPHNLREVIDAIIYRINHKNVSVSDLIQFVKGPDFPTGGYIYSSSGLNQIYETGRGRIEISGKAEIVQNKDVNQIVITEIPYKVVKIQLVYEIDKIRHAKDVDGIIEVRDESDWKGIRIVVDVKKTTNVETILQYLMKKTSLVTGYSANMVAICDGKPKTLNLLDYVDSYISHQVDVITRRSKFDLQKSKDRLHIVEGLILASLNINEVVEIIRKSNDKADSKINLMERFKLSNEQAEAIVTMPLYKLSHTDEIILETEKKELLDTIEFLTGIIEDENKLNKVLIKDLKRIAEKYGDERRTQIIEKGETKEIDKRDLVAKEEVYLAVTYDGYLKRSSVRSFSSSEGSMPGIKDGDMLVGSGKAMSTDYLLCFTNLGNYCCTHVFELTENKWKDEGTHINVFTTFASGEKIIKAMVVHEPRNDLYLGVVSKFGQIKRMPISDLELSSHRRPSKYMKLLTNDQVVGIVLLSGNSDLLVVTGNGNCSLYNENELTIVSGKAGGVKSISGLGNDSVTSLLAFNENDKGKVVLLTDKACMRVNDINKLIHTARLGRVQQICPSFKGDPHTVVAALKPILNEQDLFIINLYLNNHSIKTIKVSDFRNTEAQYAKKNIDEISSKQIVSFVFDPSLIVIDNSVVSYPVISKKTEEESENINTEREPIAETKDEEEKETNGFEQISIFDDLE